MNFLPYKTCCFYSLENYFLVLEYYKGHFPGLYRLKTYVGNMANFGPKTRINHFGKILIYGFSELLVLLAKKGVSSFKNMIKHISLDYIGKKKKLEKWSLLDQNHGLTPLKKCQFFAL